MDDRTKNFDAEANRTVNQVPDGEEGSYEIPDEACCSAEFPQGCIFSE